MSGTEALPALLFSEVEVYSAQRSNILTKLIPFQNLHRLSENIHRNISQIPPAPHPASPNKSLAKAAIKGSDRLLYPRGARGFQKNVMYQIFPHPPRKKKKQTKSHQEARARKSPDHTKTVLP